MAEITEYIPTIGIECHVQLKTRTKLFAAVGNDARQAKPNTLISHICTAMPGALPVLNQAALELAVKAGLALNAQINNFSKFERKHYFYPDLPKGYQISQYEQPIIGEGFVELEVDGQYLKVGLVRAHLEEDAGKNTHPEGADYSLVDLNRAGTPLLEIVSKPDLHSPEAAKAYARELYLLMRYANVSDCDLFYGNMRFDVNVSVSQDPAKLGIRSEVKNLNSFRAVENAVRYEIERQTDLLIKGQALVQETRGWDEAAQKTTAQRSKEEAEDYRYMPDPDIPPVILADELIEKIRSSLPQLPASWRLKLAQIKLDKQTTETLLDAEADNPPISYLGMVEQTLNDQQRARTYCQWIVNSLVPAGRDSKLAVTDASKLKAMLDGVYDLLVAAKLSSTNARSLLLQLAAEDNLPPVLEKYAEEQGYIQMSDSAEIEEIVKKILADNPKAAQDVKGGELKAVGFLVGQVMKQSLGKANPGLAQDIIKKQLGIE